MAVYLWAGIDRAGKKQKGEIEADNLPLARQMVVRKGITIKNAASEAKGPPGDYLPAMAGSVKDKDKVIFVRQFATMIDAGLPLVQCLDILQEQQDNANFKRVIRQIKKDVEEGSTLSDAVKKHPKVFDNLFHNLVAAGEIGGILDVILNRLAAYIEKMAKLKKKVKGALTYPVIVVSIAVIVVAVILIWVIPVFSRLFTDAGVKLPGMTLFVMNLSDFAKHYFHWMILGLILLIVGLRQFRKTPRGRDLFDQHFAANARLRHADPQDRRGALYQDPGDDAFERRADSGRPRSGRRHRRELGCRKSHPGGASVHFRGPSRLRSLWLRHTFFRLW